MSKGGGMEIYLTLKKPLRIDVRASEMKKKTDIRDLKPGDKVCVFNREKIPVIFTILETKDDGVIAEDFYGGVCRIEAKKLWKINDE